MKASVEQIHAITLEMQDRVVPYKTGMLKAVQDLSKEQAHAIISAFRADDAKTAFNLLHEIYPTIF